MERKMTFGWEGRIEEREIDALMFVNSALTIHNKVADSQFCSDQGEM